MLYECTERIRSLPANSWQYVDIYVLLARIPTWITNFSGKKSVVRPKTVGTFFACNSVTWANSTSVDYRFPETSFAVRLIVRVRVVRSCPNCQRFRVPVDVSRRRLSGDYGETCSRQINWAVFSDLRPNSRQTIDRRRPGPNRIPLLATAGKRPTRFT